MKVLVIPSDTSGCGFYRMQEPGQAVADQYRGSIDVQFATGLHLNQTFSGRIDNVDVQGADVVVFQRLTSLDLLQRVQRQGVAVVFEIDDLLSAIPAGHRAYDSLVRSGAAELTHRCARLADWVTASTPDLLAAYCRHGRGSVIPNAIPRRLAELPPAYERTPDPVVVGWTGMMSTHPYDLHTVGSGVQQAMRATTGRAQFTVIGQADGVAAALALDTEPVEVGLIRSVDRFVEAVGHHLDVGIAPLRDDRFNRAKSWLKPLEYAARGVFGVYGDMPEYVRLGLGVRAVRPRDWAAAITRAVNDPDWRREQAQTNRDRVLTSHLTEHTAGRWARAWLSAADHRARTRALTPARR